jgi:Mrp family chromosome partitioning ATPase
VTAPSEREEASAAAVAMAIAFASSGTHVLLLDADLRRPRIGSIVGFGEPEALARNAVLGEATGERVVQTPYEDLRLLPPSTFETHLLDLELDQLDAFLAEASTEADVVIVHAPSPAQAAESLVLADAADAVVVVVQVGRSRQDRLLELAHTLARRGVASGGFLVTSRRFRRGAPRRAARASSRGVRLPTAG